MEHSTAAGATQVFIAAMGARMAAVAAALRAWATGEARSLGALEERTLAAVQELGQALLSGVCAVVAAGAPPRTQPCRCGQAAAYVRQRAAQVRTVVGPIRIARAYDHCAHCRQGHAPLDQRLGYCAGSTSAGLDELLALLGATASSCDEAVALLDRLTAVRVCPNLARAATERLGHARQAEERRTVASAWEAGTLPPAVAAPARRYLSLDGVLVQTHDSWREYKLGMAYTTATRPSRHHPGQVEVHAQEVSFVGDVTDAATFGQLLWCAAARRGVLTAAEVVVVADGAHWIGNLVEEHFPEATQIVDWYHASQYVWQVAHAVHGDGTPLATRWAKRRLADRWDGRVDQVRQAFAAHQQRGEAVRAAITYYTNNEHRMRYADYRARGLQIGSGSVESGCTQGSTARRKQAGMRWSLDGARAVAAVRTWAKSGRWPEALALRLPRQRTYQRQAA